MGEALARDLEGQGATGLGKARVEAGGVVVTNPDPAPVETVCAPSVERECLTWPDSAVLIRCVLIVGQK